MPAETPFLDSSSAVLFEAYSAYRSLMEGAGKTQVAEQGLGGKLLYVGALDQEGRAIAIAGNVAGCATLAATANPESQKQVIRDGIFDFLVTSLDEALRILKNEIRKHSAVAVCVGALPDQVEREMHDRGVQPDLTRQSAAENHSLARDRRAVRRSPDRSRQSDATVVWSVESQPAKWLPRFDAIALDCLPTSDVWNRRWIQRSPGYLGRLSSHLRLVCSDRDFAASFIEQVRSALDRGMVATAATIWVASEAGPEIHNLTPPSQPAG